MSPYVLSQEAADDLREIHGYIAADDPAAARGFLSGYRDIGALFS